MTLLQSHCCCGVLVVDRRAPVYASLARASAHCHTTTAAALSSKSSAGGDREKLFCWPQLQRCAAPLAAALLLQASPARAAEVIQGPARAVDGDTLVVAGTRVRLYGVDAPETAQVCKDSAGREYACGEAAKEALRRHIGQAELRCEVRNRDQYGRGVASCSLPRPGGDLGAWLVDNGLAVAYRQYGRDYVAAEEGAHAARRGIWVGEFELPAQWRRERRIDRLLAAPPLTVPSLGEPRAARPAQQPPPPSAPASVAAPALATLVSPSSVSGDGCLIKGNIGAKGDRIYHVPGGRFYPGVKVDAASGERWFCTEGEAVAAGWRAARQ